MNELRRRRLDAGMTQAQLAEASGIYWRTIDRVERGESKPNDATVIAHAQALGCAPSDLALELEREAA